MRMNRIMDAVLIDGKRVAAEIKEELKGRVAELKDKGIVPGLAAVLVGENPASQLYVSGKAKACKEVGIYSEVIRKPDSIDQEELAQTILELNHRGDIDGFLVQLPLPEHIDESVAICLIDPAKDVDGFHPYNVGLMLLGKPAYLPCTPAGIVELMRRYQINPAGKEVVVLGRSNIVGKPVGVMLLQKGSMANATVTFCHSQTANLRDVCRRADILISAIGRPGFIDQDMIKEGAVVIDVGINRVKDAASPKGYRVIGDVDFETCRQKASFITPVPGGVGPMTIAMLLTNTVCAAQKRSE
jgi:methylenetetrahydrofolate dehydrogenase (NADP+)/methenyltetrahydrofolate cyclohydrolase